MPVSSNGGKFRNEFRSWNCPVETLTLMNPCRPIILACWARDQNAARRDMRRAVPSARGTISPLFSARG